MKNPITTISGGVMLVLAALSTFNVISSEEQAQLGDYATVIIEAVVGIIAIFSGDPSKRESGI